MREAGFESETLVNGFYSSINKREDWDVLIAERFKLVPSLFRGLVAFIDSLFRYDIYVISFDGFVLGHTPYWRFESVLLKIAAKKTIVIPYGGDAYVYRNIRSLSLMHCLMISYPLASKMQDKIESKVRYWCRNADALVIGNMGPDGFGRWNVLLPSTLQIDTKKWYPSKRLNQSDGRNGTVVIAHAPNHRGVKGTEFLIEAVKRLKDEGILIELMLIEKMQNDKVQEVLASKVDILVENLNMTGYGLAGLEGMASGLSVISNYEHDLSTLHFRRWSYLNECPIVSGSPETILEVLRKLVTRPELRSQLGDAGRKYVEKYHGLDSAQYLFTNVIEYLYGRKSHDTLINLYHPLLGEYPKRKPKVIHPLVNNRIID